MLVLQCDLKDCITHLFRWFKSNHSVLIPTCFSQIISSSQFLQLQHHRLPSTQPAIQDLKILHQTIDDTDSESYYHVLVDGKHFKYISIDFEVYEVDDLCFPPALLSKLPPLPSGEWNLGHIAKGEDKASPHFDWTVQRTFSSIQNIWKPVFVDYLSLDMGKMLLSNVYEATTPTFNVPIIVKFARFPWEVGYYNQETQAYSWIEGHDIGPKFLGHVTEDERVIGFLLEKIPGRHAGPADLYLCQDVVSKLHGLGIHLGDLNRHNFLVQQSRAYLVDFETARKTDDQQMLDLEFENLESQLCSTSRRGGNYGPST